MKKIDISYCKCTIIPHGVMGIWAFKRHPHKKVKLTLTIRRQKLTNCLRLFDYGVELALKGLTKLEGHIKLNRRKTEFIFYVDHNTNF